MKQIFYKGAGVALFKKASGGYSILLGKRANDPGNGKWSIFGGDSKSYEKTPFETAKREFKEESFMDLEAINGKLVGTCDFNFVFFKWTTFLYEVDESFPVPSRFSDEFSEFRFIPLDETQNYQLGFGVKREIGMFLKLAK
ncbi:MAG: NUDIX hydrolase [Spirochaetaceae bacterium]|nr:NUDIX hydrolase [Spirochaetaceae bacterium]